MNISEYLQGKQVKKSQGIQGDVQGYVMNRLNALPGQSSSNLMNLDLNECVLGYHGKYVIATKNVNEFTSEANNEEYKFNTDLSVYFNKETNQPVKAEYVTFCNKLNHLWRRSILKMEKVQSNRKTMKRK